MPWNIEPQQMLYVTAIVASYGAILATLNFLRELKKDTVRLKITARDALIDPPIVWAKSVEVVNNSSFEIEITSVGFILDSKAQLVFMPDADYWYEIPSDIPPKKSRIYPIKLERIKTLLNSKGINSENRLKPFVMVSGKSFSGKSFSFDPEKIN
ncbi:hypothetical protein D0962_19715 [Leptolyngbyaceae cyanobacterium CCMR0082]|uniref:Uncharacterized protein n=1 Tax=Adonisia turfae CCMR0082 TaxID=2304604 RepID=A0A6M0S918_9CYAN|nr:hypothetical protein [Adonisia turfae]NEZ64975.1 hypothetical protein [Adonisia turfae CCMR0082]